MFHVSCLPKRLTRSSRAPFDGPLDAYTNGLVLALLPFRGLGAYTGPWMRVRESNTSTEADIGFLADGTPDQAAFDSHVAGYQGFGRWWYDQSGGNRYHGHNTLTRHPLIVFNVLNGAPVLRYNGVNQGTSNGDTSGGGGGPSIPGSPSPTGRSWYVIFKKRSNAGGTSSRVAFALQGVSALMVDYTGSTGGLLWRRNSTFTDVPLGGSVTDWNLVSGVGTGLGPYPHLIRLNGGADTSFSGNSQSFLTLFSLGYMAQSTLWADVDVAAALVYNATHNSATRTAIETILAGKFGLSLTP